MNQNEKLKLAILEIEKMFPESGILLIETKPNNEKEWETYSITNISDQDRINILTEMLTKLINKKNKTIHD